jgi:hypothetical protein
MLTENLPVKDWQALAQKWMLNNANPKPTANEKPSGNKHNSFRRR